jgi:serine/threonine protein kinase
VDEDDLEMALLAAIRTRGSSVSDSLLSASSAALTDATISILVNLLNHVNAALADGDSFFEACKRAESATRSAEGAANTEVILKPRTSTFLRFIAVNCGLLEERLSAPSVKKQAELLTFLIDSFPEVGLAIKAIYDPARAIYAPGIGEMRAANSSKSEKRAERAWSEIDPKTFRFWRSGTTSIIIKCEKFEVEAAAYQEQLVLKCVLFPWNLIPAIAASTQEYADRYKTAGQIVVRAEASTSRWVLMPFQVGLTLSEFIAEQEANGIEIQNRVALARNVALTVAGGLEALANNCLLIDVSSSCQHLDLSPSNVMISPGASPEEHWTVRFIDLGQNHLYTRQIGIAEHDDAVYVAPEVKNRGNSPSSDFFSLAVILIEVLTGIKPRDGMIPDSIYELSPVLGRILDDMLDDESSKRLLLVPHERSFTFHEVILHLAEAFDLASREPAVSGSAFSRWQARWSPGSHELWSLGSKLFELRKEKGRKLLRRQVGYLALMSSVAVTAWGYIFVRCAFFSFDDMIVGKPIAIPRGTLLYASVIGFSQGMVASKYYQTILARLTVIKVDHPLAYAAEIGMRLTTLVALPTTILAVSWRPGLWAWTCAFGALLVAGTNFLTYIIAVSISRRGANVFSTVPRSRRLVPGGYEQWWWTMLMYALVIALIAVGLQTKWMIDAPAYVIGLLVINFAIHYASKCVIAGASVRGGLARAFATGERLTAFNKRRVVPHGAAPPIPEDFSHRGPWRREDRGE